MDAVTIINTIVIIVVAVIIIEVVINKSKGN